ncbi:MAG: diguanylate cyclase domain-containing protein [Eubacterium ventriosum]|uniref:diguanylate cyclase domain-containing protein n=1 Tax=Eubacterium ventriosum TaxID=39496 RepID=UPI0024166749|nr:diguanylate cyclase [Eubacterium ventriosum]
MGENVVVTCSIGVVFADEEREEVTLKVLTKSADKAMYQAKNSGKNRYSIVRYGEK